MADYTDLELAKMEQAIHHTYTKAQKEIQAKWDKYMAKAQPKVDKAQSVYAQAMLHGTPEEMVKAKEAYEQAALNMTLQNEHYQAMVNQITDKLAETNQIALTYLNDQMPKVYCHSYNEFGEEKIKGYSFEIVNEETVKNLIKDGNKSLLPQKQLNIPKDKQWNTKNINSQVLQGILQGENSYKISKRLMTVTDMNQKAAVRNARTMTTGAFNKGRQDSFTRATNDGVKMKRRWVVAHDARLRDWHAELDGVEVDIDEAWTNDYGEIMYPGDPAAHPANIYNCRCSIRAVIKGFKPVEKAVGIYAEQYKNVGVTNQYYAMLDENKALGNEFWKTLKAAGKPSEVWGQYILGTGSKTVAKQLDDVLAKYKGTGKAIKPGTAKKAAAIVEPPKPKPDLGMYQDKSMTATYYSVKAESKELGKEFWAVIQAEENPSAVWSQYLIGTAPKELTEKLDKILLQHKGTGAWTKPVSAKKAASKATIKTVTKEAVEESDDLIKAKNELAVAQGNLDSLGNKTYTGIWKDPVSLSDYEAKAGAIQAKKDYFLDQIDKIQNDPDWMSWMNFDEKQKASMLKKMQDKLIELDEFESQGKLYAQYAAEYKKAFDEVKKLTPVSETFGPEAYTQARKDMALWAKTKTEYNTLDKYYDKEAAKVHSAKTATEHAGYYHYTWGSGPFNAPLAGFEDGFNTSGYKLKGPGKVDINIDGYGSKIRGLTSLIEKSAYDQDIWIQSGQYEATAEAFLNIPYNSLHGMTNAELQQFVGIENEIPQFISGAINKGGGSYTPGDTIFNIYCPSGSEMLYVRSDGHFGKSEHEMILQRGGTYRLTKIEWGTDAVHGGKKLIIDFELHPENGYNKFQQ